MSPKPAKNENSFRDKLRIFREAEKKMPLLKFAWVFWAAICFLATTNISHLKFGDVLLCALEVLGICFLGFALSLFLKVNDPFIKIANYVIVVIIICVFACVAYRAIYLINQGKLIAFTNTIPKIDTGKKLTPVLPDTNTITVLKVQPYYPDPPMVKPAILTISDLIIQGKKMEKLFDNVKLREITDGSYENWITNCERYLTDSIGRRFNDHCDSLGSQKTCIDAMLKIMKKK